MSSEFDKDQVNKLSLAELVRVAVSPNSEHSLRIECVGSVAQRCVSVGDWPAEVKDMILYCANDPSLSIQRYTMPFLEQVNMSDAREILWKIIDSKNGNHGAALIELAKLQDERALNESIDWLSSAHYNTIADALIAIGFLRNKAAIPHLRRILQQHVASELSGLAAVALSRCGDSQSAFPTLKKFANAGGVPYNLPYLCELVVSHDHEAIKMVRQILEFGLVPQCAVWSGLRASNALEVFLEKNSN